jgi:hypothetical protein
MCGVTFFAASCGHPEAAGKFISANIPLALYAATRVSRRVPKPTKFTFPILEIYNELGALVYQGSESSLENARILRELPASIRGLLAPSDAPRLISVLEAVPEFQAREQEILRDRRPVLLSIELQNCEACVIQADALNDAAPRLLRQSMDVLVLKVSPF